MKTFTTLLIFLFLLACNNSKSSKEEIDEIELDRMIRNKVEKETTEFLDSINSDTSGIYAAPIIITKAIPAKIEYSNKRNIRLIYKNVSNKSIEAIKFKWKGVNAFGEPSDMGSIMNEGYGTGFTEDLIKPGKTLEATFEIYSDDLKTIVLAWPFEVVFVDGTKWILK